MSQHSRVVGLCAALALMSIGFGACDHTPTTPSGPAPAITCPAAQSVPSPTGNPVTVTYPLPTVTGGTAPVTTSCAPASGSSFPVGSTNVNCEARDADQRTASCSFAVSVTRPPQLTATNFVAFGDSITAGVLPTSCPIGGGVNCSIPIERPLLLQPLDIQRLFEGLGEASLAAYPRALQTLLAARYTGQTTSVVNEGEPGETVAAGRSRLPGVLSRPGLQVLLLQEGANDMNQSGPAIDAVVENLRAMVLEGRGRKMTVFLGTLLPQRQRGCRAYDYCDGVNDIVPTNAKIRTMAVAEGAVLVDLYQAFDGKTDTLLGLDGLHPNEAGYQRMAELFFEAIRQKLEVS